ncbi:hypothetical protein ACLB2K_065013 [Fragaria x ananassa]
MHPRLQILRPLCSLACVPGKPTSEKLHLAVVSDLLAKQRWSEVRTYLKDLNFGSVLHRVWDSGADPVLILRYLNSSNKDFNDEYDLGLTFGLLGSLAEAKRKAGEYGFRMTVFACNPLLRALVKEGEVGSVEYVYREMIRRRIKPNLYTFNMVIMGLCKVGKLEEAKDVVVNDMKAWGILPNVVSYNTLIDGYCKFGGLGRMYKADAILKEMKEYSIQPKKCTYNILISGFGKDENIPAAIKVFEAIVKQELKPNVFTCCSLINGLCCIGELDKACDLLEEMCGLG